MTQLGRRLTKLEGQNKAEDIPEEITVNLVSVDQTSRVFKKLILVGNRYETVLRGDDESEEEFLARVNLVREQARG